MWSRSRTKPVRGTVGAVMVPIMLAGSMLAGCSDIYFDRRETVALGADRGPTTTSPSTGLPR